MSQSEYNDFIRRIENAKSRSELIEILQDLKDSFDEDDPDVKILVKKMSL